MHRRARAAAILAALLLTSILAVAGPTPADAHPACPDPVVTGDRPGLLGSIHGAAFDGNEVSFFFSSHNDWQYVQVDFGCVSTFSGLARKMGDVVPHDRAFTIRFDGRRSFQGETMSYSVDGRNWTFATHATTTGWEQLGPYTSARDAWHSVPYGWSPKLELLVPVQARYVRFHWDGDIDVLNELDIDVERAGPMGIRLNCLRGEPVCTVTASGGHPGTYQFSWSTSGVFGGRQSDRASSSTFVGRCTVGARFTVGVQVTDSHGRTASATRNDRCALPF